MNIIFGKTPYELDTDGNGFPTFTQKNIDFLKGIARYDSNYSTETDAMGKQSPEFLNSYPGLLENGFIASNGIIYKFDSFGVSCSAGKDKLGNDIDVLYKVIESIDNLNSTHLASQGNTKKGGNLGREMVAENIRKIGAMNLLQHIKCRNDAIVCNIANRNVGGKHNFSFATKFCAYVSIHALGVDNYCIYDNIIQSVLPYYAYMYLDQVTFNKFLPLYKEIKGKKTRKESLVCKYKDNDDYAGYRLLIDEIIKGVKREIGVNITYTNFDRMLWYYFKGAKSRIFNAMNLLP